MHPLNQGGREPRLSVDIERHVQLSEFELKTKEQRQAVLRVLQHIPSTGKLSFSDEANLWNLKERVAGELASGKWFSRFGRKRELHAIDERIEQILNSGFVEMEKLIHSRFFRSVGMGASGFQPETLKDVVASLEEDFAFIPPERIDENAIRVLFKNGNLMTLPFNDGRFIFGNEHLTFEQLIASVRSNLS